MPSDHCQYRLIYAVDYCRSHVSIRIQARGNAHCHSATCLISARKGYYDYTVEAYGVMGAKRDPSASLLSESTKAEMVTNTLQNCLMSSIISYILYTHNASQPGDIRQCSLGTPDHESDLHSACTSVFFLTPVSLLQPQRNRRNPQSEVSPRCSNALDRSNSDEVKLHLSKV